MMNTKRKDLSLCDKLKVLDSLKNRKTQIEVAKEFQISQTQVSNIKRNAEKIEEEWRRNGNLDRKRKRKSNYDSVDEAVLEWFSSKRAKGALINGPMIMEKAESIAKTVENCENFCASKGWLYRWQQRNNLTFKTGHGEAGSVDASCIDTWCKGTLEPILEKYSPDDIFNCDETALFYRALPTGTLAQKKEMIAGLKKNKDRVTLLLCVNQTGTEKLQPLMIGKSKGPKCLKNVKNYPVNYTHSRNAWMTGKIFINWLMKLDMDFKKRNRKIVLFLDNVSSHKIDDSSVRLTNITLQFLPPNTTCKIQPLDQGIIRSFKALYRRQIIQDLLHHLDDIESFAGIHKKINILTAMHFSKKAWESVPVKVIENCFRKAKFVKFENLECEIRDDETIIYDFEDSRIQDLEEFETGDFGQLKFTETELVQFIELDENETTEDDIEITISSAQEIDGDESDDETVEPPPSLKEVNTSYAVIRRHFEACGGDYNILYKLQKEIQKCSTSVIKQSAITAFFQSK